jgi:hypothetical protein
MKVKLYYEFGNKKAYNEWGQMLKYHNNTSIVLAKYNDNDNIDYYIIINGPESKNDKFIPNKSILILDEPNEISTHNHQLLRRSGFNGWKEKETFLKVLDHQHTLNNVRWQINNIPQKIVKSALLSDDGRDQICSILSKKYSDQGHKLRVNFIKNIEKHLNYKIIDIYGRKNYHNFKYYKSPLPNNDKSIISTYKYYFQAENTLKCNYATEKIWEPILCECLCFYWGCPNLEQYIDKNSFVRLNLHDVEGSLKIIETAIKEDWWSQRIDCIRKMKKKILNELAFFPTIEKIIN